MVFSSMVFLWIFLPVMFVGYYVMDMRFKNVFLLLGSLVFYAWGGGVQGLCLILFSITVNWGIGLLMGQYDRYKGILLGAGIVINIGLLGYYKYSGFLIEILNQAFGLQIQAEPVVLPIGISFFTFQILSYVIDVYLGGYTEKHRQSGIIHFFLSTINCRSDCQV